MASETNIPESLKQYNEKQILDCLKTYVNRKTSYKVSDLKSIFAKTAKHLTSRDSTLEERLYIHHIWSINKENNINEISKYNKKIEKHLRKGNRNKILYHYQKDDLLQYEADKVVKKANIQISNKRKKSSKDSNKSRKAKRLNLTNETSNQKADKESIFSKMLGNIRNIFSTIHTTSDDIDLSPTAPLLSEFESTQQQVDDILEIIINDCEKKFNMFPTYECPICKRCVYTSQSCVRHYTFTQKNIETMQNLGFCDILAGERMLLCKRCCDNFKQNKIPSTIYMNNMVVPETPHCLLKLNAIETRLISQVKPFMKIYYLARGRGQAALKGACIHFPQSVDEIIETLPLNSEASDIVLVSETNQQGEEMERFSIQKVNLMEALEWLKCNNHLYKNIKIQFTNSECIQISNIQTERPDINENFMRYGVLSQPSEGFRRLDEFRLILRATIHQATATVFPRGGTQCAAMSMTAIAHAFVQPIQSWSSHDLDNVLFCGNQYYGQICPGRSTLLEANQANGIITCFQSVQIKCEVKNDYYAGFLKAVGGPRMLDMETSIQEFIESNHEYAILSANIYCMAIVKSQQKIYMFDSHSRGAHGVKPRSCEGTACIMCYEGETAAREISFLVNKNCKPVEKYDKNKSYQSLATFQYSLRPVNCSYVNATDVNEDSEEGEGNSKESQISIQTAVANKDFLDGENQNFSSVMLDCVIRSDDPVEPTIDRFLESCKTGKNMTSNVTLCRQQGKPLYPEKEERLEELCFINSFPTGRFGLSEPRKLKITPLDYFQQRMMSRDLRFKSNEYLFYALSRVENEIIQQKIAICGNMGTNLNQGEGQAESNCVPGLENVHLYMQAIRGSGSYWRRYTQDVLSMISQLGIPTFFITISYDDLNSKDALTALYKAKFGPDTELSDEPQNISFEERRNLLNEHPIAAARHFNNKLNVILQLLKNEGRYLFGADVIDFTARVEFQGRGSPHVHSLVWTNTNVDYNTNEGKQFIEANISCSIDVPYRELVVRYQNHAHRNTCFKKHNLCRFGFPRKISDSTKILDEDEIARNFGRFVELKRTADEIMINNYHPKLLQILKCNMDIQLVTGVRSIAFYIGKYMSKGEPQLLRREIQNVMHTYKTKSKNEQREKALKIANLIMKQREISAQEAAFRLLHLPLRRSSRGTVFVPTNQPQNRLRLIRKETIFEEQKIAGLNIIDRYVNRPTSLEQISLIEFAAWYKPSYKKKDDDCDADLAENEDEQNFDEQTSLKITLKNNKGRMVIFWKTFRTIKILLILKVII